MSYRNRTERRRFKTVELPGDPVKGEGLDYGRYFHCANCGFICDITRDALGGSSSRDGVSLTDVSITPDRYGDPVGSMASLDVLNGVVALENGSDGLPKPIRHTHQVGGTGCPLCHSLNWRGDN